MERGWRRFMCGTFRMVTCSRRSMGWRRSTASWYLRIAAARAAAENEAIVGGLERGELSLSTIKLVAPHLGEHPELVHAAAGKSKRAVERLVAETAGTSKVRTELRTRAVPGGRVELTCVVSQD